LPTPNRRSGQNVVWMTCYRLIILSDQYRLSLGTASQLARVWPDTTIFCHWHGTCSLQNGAWEFDVHVTVHRDKFLIIKPNRCTNFSNLFWKETTCFGQFLCPSSGVFHRTHSNGVCHTGLLTACEQEHMLLLASCQQTCMTYHCCVYGEKLLMMDRGTVRNM